MKKTFKVLNKMMILVLFIALIQGCKPGGLELQKNYDYEPQTIDPHINRSAWQYLKDRSYTTNGDTIFKWMRMGIEYAGLDSSEFLKPERTFIFLHNDAIRKVDSKNKITGGMFFDLPVVEYDAKTNLPLKNADGTLKTHPAVKWSDYSRQTVKNYLLYLIIDGQYSFGNLGPLNTSIKTLLPAGTIATKETKLGFLIAPSPSGGTSITVTTSLKDGNGFDPEGKMNLRLENSSSAPIVLNDKINGRTTNIIATNGFIHVYDKTLYPFR